MGDAPLGEYVKSRTADYTWLLPFPFFFGLRLTHFATEFAKPFEPPSTEHPLRFRYTSYMGEFHPAEKKVVVEFCPADLDLTAVQQNKLKKLAGVRYNPEKEIVRMGCEMFEHQAQNKRYLGDLVDTLIAEAKVGLSTRLFTL